MKIKAKIMDENAINRALRRIGHEIIERNRGIDDLVLIGIPSRGVPMAQRLVQFLGQIEGREPLFGVLDKIGRAHV